MERKFVIKNGNLFLSNHPSMHHWTEDRDKAMVFEFYTIALGFAIELNFDNYVIEAIY